MSSKLKNIKQFSTKYKIEKNNMNFFVSNIILKDIFVPQGIDYNKKLKGKKLSKSLFHSKCLISGRNKANFNKFKMSRMIFKKYSEFGFLNGIRKATW